MQNSTILMQIATLRVFKSQASVPNPRNMCHKLSTKNFFRCVCSVSNEFRALSFKTSGKLVGFVVYILGGISTVQSCRSSGGKIQCSG